MAEHKLYFRDSARARIAELGDFVQLEYVRPFNEVGTWLLQLSSDALAAEYAVFGNGVIIVRDGVTVLSGPIRGIEREWSEAGDTLAISGTDDMSSIRGRLCLPVVTGPPYGAAEHDVRTGVASTIMRQYVNYNAGPLANGPRQVGGLVLGTDPVVGATITGRARMTPLLTMLQNLGNAAGGNGLGFKITPSGTDLVFDVYAPVDRTATTIFSSALGNLRYYQYTVDAPKTNYVILGGSGVGTARVFVEVQDSESIIRYGRVEEFYDRRDVTDTPELTQIGNQILEEQSEMVTVIVLPLDTQAMAYGVGYDLGDKVRAIVGSAVIDQVVRQVHVRVSQSQGEEVEVTLATAGAVDPRLLGVFKPAYKGAANSEMRLEGMTTTVI